MKMYVEWHTKRQVSWICLSPPFVFYFLSSYDGPRKKSLYDLAILPGENTHKSLN